MAARVATRGYEPFATRLHPAILALWVFIATEALFFGILIASYLYLRLRSGAWPPPNSPDLDLLLPAANTVVLLASGLTMHGAVASLRQGDDLMMKGGVVATIVLGGAFLLGQAFEYTHAGFGLSSGLLGSSFFTLTGFHGAHVFAGLLLLVLVLAKVSLRPHLPGRHPGLEAAALYWHFVDAVWVAVFTVLYLV